MNQQLLYDNIILSWCQQWILSCRRLTKDNFTILSSFQIHVKQILKKMYRITEELNFTTKM